MVPIKLGMAMDRRIAAILTVTINSIRVNPECLTDFWYMAFNVSCN
jgi:hypothetical protein